MKKFDVVYGDKYVDRNGEEKTKWINCGAVIQTKNGYALKLESMPINCNGWFSLFEPKPRDNQSNRQANPAQSSNDLSDEDLPF